MLVYAHIGVFTYCIDVDERINVLYFTDMISALSSLTAEEKKDESIAFALSFRSAYSLNNYHRMFKLYTNPPKMTGYLIDMFLSRERIRALKTMVKAYVYITYSHTLGLFFYQDVGLT